MTWWIQLSIAIGGWAVLFLVNVWLVRGQHRKSAQDLMTSTRESLRVLETKFDLGVVTWEKFDKSVQRIHDRVSDVEKDTAIDLNQLADATQGIEVQVTQIAGKIDAFTRICELHQKQTDKIEKKHEADFVRLENEFHRRRA